MDRPIICNVEEVRRILRDIQTPGTGTTVIRRFTTSPMAKVMAGDCLWVREPSVTDESVLQKVVGYIADGEPDVGGLEYVRHRDSLHMPRWASRITLEVTKVWFEKVQERSEAECLEEGFSPETWAQNPTVFAIEFRPVLRNIDTR